MDDYIQTNKSKIKEIVLNFLTKYLNKLKKVIVIIAVSWCFVTLFLGAQIKSLSVFEKFLYTGHAAQRVLDWKDDLLWNDPGIFIDFIWGIEPTLDTTNVNKWDKSFVGTLRMDNEFNLYPKEN